MKAVPNFMTILMVFIVSGSPNLNAASQQSDCSHSIYSGSSSPSTDDVNPVVKAFQLFAIVPQVLPYAPTEKLSIIYYDKASANLGNYIMPYKLGYSPFIYWKYKEDTLYSIFFINPDARGLSSSYFKTVFLSELRVNIPGNNILAGDLLVAYSIYLPPTFSKPNRNIFVVYEQKQAINVTLDLKINVSTNMTSFDFNGFVDEHDLGEPVAGNFFTSYIYFCDQ